MQELDDTHFKEISDETADFLTHETVKTSEQDRFSSFCNTLRGYEEFILSPDGVIMSSNLEAVNVTGYEEWEVIGRHFSMFYSAEELATGQPEQDLENALHLGKVFYSGNRIKKKGISFLAKIRITPIRNDIGMFCGFRMVMKDTTHNALYNYRVKRVRDEYMNLFNNSFIGIFKFRLHDSRILLINDKAKDLLGISEHDEVPFRQFFADPDQFNSFLKALETEETANTEIHLHSRGVWLSVNCRAYSKQGFAEGVLVDVTEKKKQLEELRRLNQEIDKFIYHSSHDMRAPLTTIMGLTHLINLECNNNTPVQQYNVMVQEQVNHLDNLLKSLVNITFNKSTTSCEIIDFEKELEVILRDFRHHYQNVRVHSYFEGSHRFFSDPARIHIILKNLISNAFRFHNPTIDYPSVHIKIVETDKEAIISIADNGIGIDESCVESIFTMFYKAERGSTGLGLYIVKSMVDKLGGSIRVRSRRSVGSTFTVRLPNLA